RQNRPWTGQVVEGSRAPAPRYVEDCYLCPGNRRVSGAVNPPYTSHLVFDNDHPCVSPEAPPAAPPPGAVNRSRQASRIAGVVCYSPRHALTLAEMETAEIASLLGVLREQYLDLIGRPGIQHVLVFENKGTVVGVSNPHPHCQIYATNFVFK